MIGRVAGVALALILASCSSSEKAENANATGPPTSSDSAGSTSSSGQVPEELFPAVVDVKITASGTNEFLVAVTLSSPYDSPERYADAWRVLDASGNELGVRELTHDHASEQPFTRSATITIPEGIDEVTVEGRDQVSGYGGVRLTVPVPR